MKHTKFMPMPGTVKVEYDEWKNWRVPGWPDKAPNVLLLNFIYNGLIARRRPFILVDSEGVSRNVVSIVDCMVDKVRPGDQRLYVVYTHTEDGEALKAAYGELLFIDHGQRIPQAYRYDLYTWWLATRERLFPRRKGVAA